MQQMPHSLNIPSHKDGKSKQIAKSTKNDITSVNDKNDGRPGSKKKGGKKDENEPEYPTNPLAIVVDSEEKQLYQPLSYKKLMKVICTMHPVDPDSKEKFDIRDRITVKDYYQKVTDFMQCYRIGLLIQEAQRQVRKHFNKENNIQSNIVKPESMMDLPDSDSDS